MPAKQNKEEFIEKVKKRHGETYDYSKVDYINSQTKVIITCPKHGDFLIKPADLVKGRGCPKCGYECGAKKQRSTTEEFVEKAKKIYGDRYNYSKVEYKGRDEKVCIICPEHGEFWQTPHNHLRNHGCPKCAGFMVNNLNDFVRKSTEIHKGKYTYEKAKYITTHDNICITCPEHGDFWMLPLNHIRGQGCPKCKYKKFAEDRRLSKEEFVERAQKIHNNKYNYDKVEYVNMNTKVCITCPSHGDFWMQPNNHLQGQGCRSCKQSSLETIMELDLRSESINFEKQKRFSWLGRKQLDFYLPDYNAAIECQGIHHFRPTRFNGSLKDEKEREEVFNGVVRRDEEKRELCNKNGVNLYYYSNLGIEYPYQVYEDFDELLNEIKKGSIYLMTQNR